MSSLKRIGIAWALAANGLWATTGCLSHNGRLGGGTGGDGSVLASIGGVSVQDLDRPFTYELICGTVHVKGEAKADDSFVRFPGDKLKNGDECAMEIRVSPEEAAKLNHEWYGVKDGAVDVGLFYGSDLQKINAGKLSLTLYSLAASIVDDPFTVQANIQFEAEAKIPAEASAKASLICGETEKYPGDFKKEAGALEATLIFTNLDAKLLVGKTCTSVAVLVDNVVAFAGDTADLKLDDVKKKDVKIFPDAKDATKRYTVKAVAVGGGDVDTSTTGGGICLKYEDHVCKDVRSSTGLIGDLPYVETYVLARVQGKIGDQGRVQTYIVAAADGDLIGRIKTKTFNVTDMNDSLEKDTKTFLFFQDVSDADLLKPAFDANFIAGKHLTKETTEELKGFKVLNIVKIYAHGMHQVDAAALNAASLPAVWLTHVKAKKNTTVSEFFVSGKTAGFSSTAAPMTVDGKPVFFDFAKLASDMAQAPGSDRWQVYAVHEGAMASADCTQTADSYIQGASYDVLENLVSVNNGEFQKCEVSQRKFDGTLASGFDISAEHYLWEWFIPKK